MTTTPHTTAPRHDDTEHGDRDGEVLRITGGTPLTGATTVQGGKNIALHLYAAALACDTPVLLRNAPGIVDTDVCAAIARHTGAEATRADGDFRLLPSGDPRPEIHPVLGGRVRITTILGAAILARAGRVSLPRPGGDAFCARLIDRHLAAMTEAGATLTDDGHTIRAVLPPRGPRPFRVDVNTPYGPSMGATVTALLLAARARGTSLITHPSIEPEVLHSAVFLAKTGVGIDWADDGLHVTGTDRLTGTTHTIPGDRIAAATWAMACAATGGHIRLDGITLPDLPTGLTTALTDAGVRLTGLDDAITVTAPDRLAPITATTAPHPGLPTDTPAPHRRRRRRRPGAGFRTRPTPSPRA